jgi:hypothetical protein
VIPLGSMHPTAAITNAISQGEDIMLVAAFAGHAKTSTTTDIYGHVMPKRAQEAARRMRSVSHMPSHTLPTNDDEQRPARVSAES